MDVSDIGRKPLINALNAGLVASLAILGGCAELSYAQENYGDVAIVHHQHGQDMWRIFDKPAENRLMITSSIGTAVGGGAAQGLTFGLSGAVGGPQGNFRAAAQSYLDAKGQGCRITDGALLIEPQYEFFYECRRRP